MRLFAFFVLIGILVTTPVAQVTRIFAPVQSSGTIRMFAPDGTVKGEFGTGQQHPTSIVLGSRPNSIFVADDGNNTITDYDSLTGVRASVRGLPLVPSTMTKTPTGTLLCFDRTRQIGFEYDYAADSILAIFVAPTGFTFAGLVTDGSQVLGVSENQGARIVVWSTAGGLPTLIKQAVEPNNYYAGLPSRDGNWVYTVLRDQFGNGDAHPRRFSLTDLTWDSGFSGGTPGWRYCFQYIYSGLGPGFGLIHDPSFGTTVGIFNPSGVLSGWFPTFDSYGYIAVAPNLLDVSGRVKQNGLGVSGVTIRVQQNAIDKYVTVTDANGNFRVSVAEGSYTLLPEHNDKYFFPGSREVTVAGSSLAGQDFTAANNGPVSIQFEHPVVYSDQSRRCTLNLIRTTPVTREIAMRDDTTKLTSPIKVTVPAGQRSAGFFVYGVSVISDVTATITASHQGVVATGSITVRAKPVLTGIALASSVKGGIGLSGSTTIDKPAVGAMYLVLDTDNHSVAFTSPSETAIPSGSTTKAFYCKTYPVAVTTNVTVSASFYGSSVTKSLQVRP